MNNVLNEILRQLDNVKKTGNNQYESSCPVPGHGKGKGDRNPSLSISENKDGIALYCHAGCGIEDIVNALNIKKTDLFYNEKFRGSTGTPKSKKLSQKKDDNFEYKNHYDYFNLDYDIQFRMVKFVDPKTESKKFIPYHEKNNNWVKGMGDQEKILYNLPAVIESIDKGQTIFLVEGEKDVNTLNKMGYTATCNPFGAGKWNKNYTESLTGAKEVIVIPDNDEPGFKHLTKVGQALYGKVDKLKMLKLPALKEGEDFTDWVNEHNGNKERLERLLQRKTYNLDENGEIDKTPELISSKELMKKDFPEPVWTIPDLIPSGLTILAGKPKVGKSWFCLHLANAVSQGGYAFGQIEVERQTVLYLALEDSQRRLKDRMIQLDYKPSNNFFVTNESPKGPEGLLFLREQLEENPDIKLIMIDTLFKFKKQQKNGNKNPYDVDYETMTPLQELAIEFDISIIAVHHMRKGTSDNFLEEVSGTFGLTAGADTVIGLSNNNKGQSDLIFEVKGRDVEEKNLALNFSTYTDFELLGRAEEYQQSGERVEIIELLKEADKPLALKEISDILGKNNKTIYTLLNKMLKEGIIIKPKYGKYKVKGIG